MNIIYYISNITIPIILVIILMHGYIKNVDLFDAFISGAYDGLKMTASILPSLIGLITAVGIFRSSGAMDFLCKIVSPISRLTGFPSALVPMSITKMFSSSAATGMLLDIFKNPDSTVIHISAVEYFHVFPFDHSLQLLQKFSFKW